MSAQRPKPGNRFVSFVRASERACVVVVVVRARDSPRVDLVSGLAGPGRAPAGSRNAFSLPIPPLEKEAPMAPKRLLWLARTSAMSSSRLSSRAHFLHSREQAQ